MTTATKIIERARLQAAAENAWRHATHLHNSSAWNTDRIEKLALPELYPSVTAFNPSDNIVPMSVPQLPHVVCRSDTMPMGVRVILTAPSVDVEWFWVACLFPFSRAGMNANNIKYNYTN